MSMPSGGVGDGGVPTSGGWGHSYPSGMATNGAMVFAHVRQRTAQDGTVLRESRSTAARRRCSRRANASRTAIVVDGANVYWTNLDVLASRQRGESVARRGARRPTFA